MKRRIFIAINLPEDVKNKLQQLQRKWADLPVRFVKRDSLHLTIVFVGYVSDEEMLKICQAAKAVAKRRGPLTLSFNRICLGPHGKPPRLIWLEGEKSQELIDIKSELENRLLREIRGIGREKIEMLPHITLARIRQAEWRGLLEKPQIDERVSISAPVNSIEVMESNLQRSGAEYTVLESADLG